MTVYFIQGQVIVAVPGLSQARLATFLDADLIIPVSSTTGPRYRPVDLARLELLCDLADQFDLESDASGVMIGLIDQLHTARLRLHAMSQAMADEPHDLRQRVGARLVAILAV